MPRAMTEIIDAIKAVKQAEAARRRAERERGEFNDVAKKQRVEIRRLKRLLDEAMKLIPGTVRNDKLFEEIDDALHKDEL